MKLVATKEEFDSTLKGTDLLVVVDFFATWCGPCKMIAPKVEEWAKEYDGKVLFLKVDVDENEETAEACEIQAMPTFVFYKNAEKVDEIKGANQAKILELIEKYK